MTSLDLQTLFIPLSILIVLGWVIGRKQDIDVKSIATLLVYVISPIVAFGSTAQLNFRGVYVLLPVITYILAAINGLSSFAVGKRILAKKELSYLLPIVTGSGNNGYFGLPLAMALFAPEWIGVYFLITLGVTLFEATLGFYFVARGHLSVSDALRRVVKMPVIYAIASGLVCAAFSIQLDPSLLKLWEIAKGCYVMLGMMLIGLALAKHNKLAWEKDFLLLGAAGKYLSWLLLALGFIWLDRSMFQIYDPEIHKMLLILAITPVAANTAAFAAQNNFQPQHAATVVFLTTIFSFSALPFILPLVFGVGH